MLCCGGGAYSTAGGMRPAVCLQAARIFAALLNSFFLLCSLLILGLACLATINPPKADVSPAPLNSYPQYIVTLLLISSYSICLFLLSSLGLLSLCFLTSFLISVHILGQIAMVSAQLIAVAFTITVRKRLHAKLQESWQMNEPAQCHDENVCVPLQRFLHSEALFIISLCVFLFLQVLLLIASSFLAERQSSEERKLLLLQRDEDDD